MKEPYHVVGSQWRPYQRPSQGRESRVNDLSIAILQRSRDEDPIPVLSEYQTQYPCFEILYACQGSSIHDLARLRSLFPRVRFLLFDTDIDSGGMINSVARETFSDYFLLIWSDMRVVSPLDPLLLAWIRKQRLFCTTPVIYDRVGEALASISVPTIDRGVLEIISMIPEADRSDNLFPCEGVGVYDRIMFQRIRGADTGYRSFRMQMMDLGAKVWLTGGKIRNCAGFMVTRSGQDPAQEVASTTDTARFHNKILSIRKRFDRIRYPLRITRRAEHEPWDLFDLRYRLVLDIKTLCRVWGEKVHQ